MLRTPVSLCCQQVLTSSKSIIKVLGVKHKFIHFLNKNTMLFTTHNPTKRVSHTVLKDEKHFTVQFTCLITGKTAIEKYAVPLTTKEIEAEYDYISFK